MYHVLLIAMLFLAGCGSPTPYVVDPTQGMTPVQEMQGKSFLLLQRGYSDLAEFSDMAKQQDTKAENTKMSNMSSALVTAYAQQKNVPSDIGEQLILHRQMERTLESVGAKIIHDIPVISTASTWNDVLKAAEKAGARYVVVLGYVQTRPDTKTSEHSSNIAATIAAKTLLPIYPMEYYSTSLKYDRPFAVYDAQSGKLLLDGMLKPDVVTSYRLTIFGQSEAADPLTNCGKALAVESRSFVEQVTPIVAP